MNEQECLEIAIKYAALAMKRDAMILGNNICIQNSEPIEFGPKEMLELARELSELSDLAWSEKEKNQGEMEFTEWVKKQFDSFEELTDYMNKEKVMNPLVSVKEKGDFITLVYRN